MRNRHLLSGAGSGAFTALWFAALHHLIISDIWFSLMPMMVVGALCGLSLAWSFASAFPQPAPRVWARYNGAWLLLLMAAGVGSVVVFDPVIPVTPELVTNGPTPEILAQAVPYTAVCTLAAALAVSFLWGRRLATFGAILITALLLMLPFGVNISLVGMLDLSGYPVWVVAEFFALVVAILVGNALAFWALERRGLLAGGRSGNGGAAATGETGDPGPG